MQLIAFLDTEIEPQSGKILDIGCIKSDGSTFHSSSIRGFTAFINGANYFCGHNIIHHDFKYLRELADVHEINQPLMIDTLYLSPLIFPQKPYHALVKDDKLQTDDYNNPLNDAKKARDLFYDEVSAFIKLDNELKQIYYLLLKDVPEFKAFFIYLEFTTEDIDPEGLIRAKFYNQICEYANLTDIILKQPLALAYCLALINSNNRYSITPPWVIKNYPEVEGIMKQLRNRPCIYNCSYCSDALDIHNTLQKFFGFSSYRTYQGEPLQELAVKAAINNKSILAVFPTGGGKSLTFQIPALMAGVNEKGLTVVISPLQSLMKDQIDNLEERDITDAVTINGLLDPIERAKSFERIEDGSASLLYISPESLRSKTIERLLLGRHVVRFVIDEAHCFSAWGQDFRVDYLYIADFIKSLQVKKNLNYNIPVSCFTATAKPAVIEDICQYFKEKLAIDLEIFQTNATRINLRYKVLERESDEEKYATVRDLLREKPCPTIIYVSRTGKAYKLAKRLNEDGFSASPYHGKMDKGEKSANQEAFIKGEVQIMVATSAFGMGVDKKDVGMVIHYEISDSLENYMQEAGRAGRDENILADCFVLYDDEDLGKHFTLLNQSKLNIQEIQQIWKSIKDITRFRSKISQSALEIAQKAGWDDNIIDIETRVKTAIAALEGAGYIKRGQNMPRVYADSILAHNSQEAIDRINNSSRFNEKQKEQANRIMNYLISRKNTQYSKDDTLARVDYISDNLGILKEEVIEIINLLRLERLLADSKDLIVFLKKEQKTNQSLRILELHRQLELYLLSNLTTEEQTYNLKKLNAEAQEIGLKDVNIRKIKTILNFWSIKNYIKRKSDPPNQMKIYSHYDPETLADKLTTSYELARFIVEYLFEKSATEGIEDEYSLTGILVEFSLLELKEEFENRTTLFNKTITHNELENALFYLTRIEALKIEGGFLVIYNPLTIERLEMDNRIRYKLEDYQQLNQFYQSKIQQIHIVGEYARKMLEDYKAALEFVDDYFQLNYSMFLRKYFKTERQEEINRNITPSKFRQLFGELSPDQLTIINDNEAKNIVVAAGPGSGKTRILVHKLASLLLMEDVKQEQLLMLTFSRSAATDFKKRLIELIGPSAYYVEIKTFHSFCFDLLGRMGSLEKSDDIIRETIRKIKNGEVEVGRITKTVLVIDEAQDMSADEFALIKTLKEENEDMRIIAAGDDDQNIYEFRGSSSKYMAQLAELDGAIIYEMLTNYRSQANLVKFANQFARQIHKRLKKNQIKPHKKDTGEIHLIKYHSPNLITPVVNFTLATRLIGGTCILTRTNEEALQVSGLLLKNSIKTKLIQSNDEFNLYDLVEVRFLLTNLAGEENTPTLDDDDINKAKQELKKRFPRSPNLEIVKNIIKDFTDINHKTKYLTDLDIFIRESKLEDFAGNDRETIYVSTIHKAKGREYDNVILLLNRFIPQKDEDKRLLYVAMTRAKNKLFIHYNGNYLDNMRSWDITYTQDVNDYPPPAVIAQQLTHRDIWLDYFIAQQNSINILSSGDILDFDGNNCFGQNGKIVLKTSQKFKQDLEKIQSQNYQPQFAQIKHIVYWRKKDTETEVKIILPEIYFERKED